MRSKFVAGVGAAVGCSALPRLAMGQDDDDPPFDPKGYGKFLRRADGKLDGTLAVQLADGTLRAKSGARVVAFPNGPYVRGWLRRSAAAIPASSDASAFDTPPIPDALARFTRSAPCDRDGNFFFDNLPYGEYIVRGHLSVALPQKAPAATHLDADRVEIIDYVYLWLDSEPTTVTGTTSPYVTFGVAARRDRVQRVSV